MIIKISSMPTPRIKNGRTPTNATKDSPEAITRPKPDPIPRAIQPIPTRPNK